MAAKLNLVNDTYKTIISREIEKFYDEIWKMVLSNKPINWSELFIREKELIINSLMSNIKIRKKIPVKNEVDVKSVVIR